MKENKLQATAWILALADLTILLVSSFLVILNPAGAGPRFSEILSGSFIACGAPVLGLVILRQQPRNRIGWLWLFYGLAMSFFILSFAIKGYASNSSPAGYPAPVFVMLLLNEMANIVRFICLALLMLWFPDGQPPSHRWRFMHWWAAIAFLLTNIGLFEERIRWTEAEGIHGGPANVNNPLGFLPERLSPFISTVTVIGFFSIVMMLILAALSIAVRYHSSGQVVRLQIRWFFMGSVIFIASLVASLYFMPYLGNFSGVLTNLAIMPFYLATGIAILRYRLWDIDILIRKTLVYGALTLTLALVYFGSVVLLQSLVTAVGGQQSPVITVISTLLIAAMFTPLRKRIQSDIDRRFYRKKYDAEKTVAAFSTGLRQEVDLEQIGERLLSVVEETMQPESVSLWLRKVKK